MSGGVGPTGDIALPKEEDVQIPEDEISLKKSTEPANKSHSRRGLFTFRQLNALAVIIVFSATGMVSLQDLGFVLFSLIYILFLSKISFPSQSPHHDDPRVYSETNKLLRLYVFFAAVIGLFLPIAYIFEGIFEGDKEGIKAATPHVFLLASQVFMEGLSARFSIPIRVFVPVFYNSRRIFTLVDWVRSEIYKVENHEYLGSGRRFHVGRALAVANMGLWCFNLFGFLLPFYLPKAMGMYYSSSSFGYKLKDRKD